MPMAGPLESTTSCSIYHISEGSEMSLSTFLNDGKNVSLHFSWLILFNFSKFLSITYVATKCSQAAILGSLTTLVTLAEVIL